MKTRIITGVCMFFAALPAFIFGKTALFVTVLALELVAVFEMLRCLGGAKTPALTLPSFLYAAAVPCGLFFVYGIAGRPVGCIVLISALTYFYVVALLVLATLSGGKVPVALAAESAATVFYITVGFTGIVMTRLFPHGLFFLIMTVVIAFGTDTFAYFSGMLFGKHKLIPSVSPKKTVEGAIGGTLLSTLAFVGCGYLYAYLYPDVRVRLPALILCGFLLAIVSQLGDLVASYIKRASGIKDYGGIFPGHGGVLDRFDSIIAVAPTMCILLFIPGLFPILS